MTQPRRPRPPRPGTTGATGVYARPGRPRRGARRCSPSTPTPSLVAGSTDWGVEVNIRGARAPFAIGIDRLPELRTLDLGDDSVEIGAALTLSEVERGLAGRVPLLAEVFPQFASRLIRNGATIGGNLGTGSPIGDTPPALLALEAVVVLASRRRRPRGAAGRLLHRLPADRASDPAS